MFFRIRNIEFLLFHSFFLFVKLSVQKIELRQKVGFLIIYILSVILCILYATILNVIRIFEKCMIWDVLTFFLLDLSIW